MVIVLLVANGTGKTAMLRNLTQTLSSLQTHRSCVFAYESFECIDDVVMSSKCPESAKELCISELHNLSMNCTWLMPWWIGVRFKFAVCLGLTLKASSTMSMSGEAISDAGVCKSFVVFSRTVGTELQSLDFEHSSGELSDALNSRSSTTSLVSRRISLSFCSRSARAAARSSFSLRRCFCARWVGVKYSSPVWPA